MKDVKQPAFDSGNLMRVLIQLLHSVYVILKLLQSKLKTATIKIT